MIIEVIGAFIATFGFGIIFNIKDKNLYFAAICGALGWFVYKLSLSFGLKDTTSLFLASVSLSLYSEIFARILKTPVTTFIIAALIPLVPGGGMYYTMVEVITGDITKSLEIGINTLSSAGVLALGVVLVSSITKTIMNNKNKKVEISMNKNFESIK